MSELKPMSANAYLNDALLAADRLVRCNFAHGDAQTVQLALQDSSVVLECLEYVVLATGIVNYSSAIPDRFKQLITLADKAARARGIAPPATQRLYGA